jgi:inner membrane protein involved in colicin E2 resistance
MIVSDSKSIVDAVRESAFVKVMVVGFLMIVLLIPLSMIHGMIRERTSRRNDVVSEVSRTWSNPQVAGGFILSVPYTVTQTNDYGKPSTDASCPSSVIAACSMCRSTPRTSP